MDYIFKRYVALYSLVALVILAVVSGFRSSQVGADYESYKDMFYTINDSFSGGVRYVLHGEYFFEPGFALLIAAITSFTNNHIVFFITISFLATLIMLNSLNKLSMFPLLSILIFYSYDFFTNYMVAIRFGLATALGLVVLVYLSQKKHVLTLVFILLAMSMHTAAIGLFLPFFMSFFKLRRFHILFAISMALIVGYISLGGVVVNNLLPGWIPRANSAEFYANDSMYGNSLAYLGLINVKYLLLSLVVYVFWDKLKEKTKHFDLLVMFLISAMTIRVGFHDLGFIAGRVSALLGIVEIIIVPALLFKVLKNKLIAFSGVVMYASLHLIFILFVRGYSEYSSIFR